MSRVSHIPQQPAHEGGRRRPPAWTVLSTHGRVLALIASDPDIRVRDIAATLGVTERTVQRVIADLEETGHLSHDRIGTRNRYEISETAGPPVEGDLDPEILATLMAGEPETAPG